MSKGRVPDAWEDDWVSYADQAPTPKSETPAKISKRERRAQHAEQQRQLWESADAERPIHLMARDEPPVKTEFKPTMKLLSRRPPTQATTSSVTQGVSSLSVNPGEDPDSEEEEERRKFAQAQEERKLRMQKEREEKQRKYQEARERLFGPQPSTSAAASPGHSARGSRSSSPSQDHNDRPQSRGRGGRERGRGRGNGRNSPGNPKLASRNVPSQNLARANEASSEKLPSKSLYDADYAPKPDSIYVQRQTREQAGESSASLQAPQLIKPIREPRGPDGSGRGFGSFSRGQSSR